MIILRETFNESFSLRLFASFVGIAQIKMYAKFGVSALLLLPRFFEGMPILRVT